MGIFECSYSGVSSVRTVTRLPEAHALLFVVACRLALGRTEPDIQQILARAFPWGKAVGVKFTTHLHFPHIFMSWHLIQHRDECTFFYILGKIIPLCCSITSKYIPHKHNA